MRGSKADQERERATLARTRGAVDLVLELFGIYEDEGSARKCP